MPRLKLYIKTQHDLSAVVVLETFNDLVEDAL